MVSTWVVARVDYTLFQITNDAPHLIIVIENKAKTFEKVNGTHWGEMTRTIK